MPLHRPDSDHAPAVAFVDRAGNKVLSRKAGPVLSLRDGEGFSARQDRARTGVVAAKIRTAERAEVIGHTVAVGGGKSIPAVEFVSHDCASALPCGSDDLAGDDVLGVSVSGSEPDAGFGTFKVQARANVDDACARIRPVDSGPTAPDHP